MRRMVAAALGAAALVACQAGLSGPAPGQRAVPDEVGVGVRSTFVVASPLGLLGLDAQGRPLGRIVQLPAGAFPSGPTLHPDGRTLFFALSATKPGIGFGSEIYSVDLDGTRLRPVLTRDQPNLFYASPAVDAAGTLYAHRRVAKDDPGNPGVYTETVDEIDRVDPASGERRTVIRDGAEPALVPGGASLVFVHFDRGQQDGLWTAASDGTGARPLLRTGDRFSWLQAPRVSPTGREVVWSSAGRSNPRSSLPATVARAGSARSGSGGKLAHLEIPSELYVAPLDGTAIRSIATTGDDVVPSWSADGTKIAYIALATFYVVAGSDGTVITHTQGIGFTYGELIWLPRSR